MKTPKMTLLLLLLLLGFLAGCASTAAVGEQPLQAKAVETVDPMFGPAAAHPEMAGAPYHEHALYNYALGRRYLAEGRYELARERFLFALAAARAGEADLRARVIEELDVVEKIIVAQR